MKRLFAYFGGMLVLTAILSGCGSLKSIHGYTTAAVDGVSDFYEVDYDFEQSCLDRCRLTYIRDLSIQRDTACDCTLYQRADSVTQLIYNAVASYLTAMDALSSKDLTTYNLDALQTAVGYGDFAALHLTDVQANAYTALSRLLLSTTDLYQMKKLRQFIIKANPPLQILIQKLQFILQQNLQSELNFKKESLYAYDKEMSMDSTLSLYEKSKLVKDYYDQLSGIRLKQKRIDMLVQILVQVASGHQYIYDHVHDLSRKKIKSAVHQYAINIASLDDALKQLK